MEKRFSNRSGRIVHREYTNAYPCKFTIFSDRVETENANNPRGSGKIDPTNFAPFPKNPTIAKFFIQLGRVEELGSGVLNVSKLIKEYTNGGEASFIEGDVFRIIIPLIKNNQKSTNDNKNKSNDAVNDGTIDRLSGTVVSAVVDTLRVINDNKEGVTTKDIIPQINKSSSSIDRYLKILKDIGLIEYKGSPKTGKYYIKENPYLR